MAKANHFIELPLERVIGDRFGRYSKYIIQDRALPDVRDGLKPVQRRILYAMHVDKNTHENNFRKAARTVGTVIGNYHPHGDSSVYEAMVRLSQDWKMRYELIEMHGNNGSIDGDPAAAMRYTEARLAKLASELLVDIDKETVDFIPNFDDTNKEPVVFPAKLPNLLINGSTGISAGYATNIPPHNLEEVIDAIILKIDRPKATVEQLMEKIKGPDFPTGGIVQGRDGIVNAFKKGRGRIVVRGKTRIEKMKGNRECIIIEEIPYDVNKANLVRKIDELHLERKVEGISEVRDETDRSGLRIVVELKKDADSEGILQYLFKNTDLQVTYNYNMVAIQDRTPKLLSLPEILDAYIAHQKEVVTRQTNFDLNKAKERFHIVEGLIKAISILDELIELIRRSKNRQDAKEKLIAKFKFTELQADAILNLQLYRLTNTDVTLLEKEQAELQEKMVAYERILNDEKELLKKIKQDLRTIKRKYPSKRRTVIEEEIEELKINIEVTVPTETVVVSLTKDGYIKRTSLRSYSASNREDLMLKKNDYLTELLEVETTDQLMLFTNYGKYILTHVHELPDIRWKETGVHISNLTDMAEGERIICALPFREFSEDRFLVFFTKQGLVKKSLFSEYETTRKLHSLIALNLRDGDEVVNVVETDGKQELVLTTKKGYGCRFHEEEVSPVGLRARGVIGIKVQDKDDVLRGFTFSNVEESNLFVVTQRGAGKRMPVTVIERTNRARRGQYLLRPLKTKPHELVYVEAITFGERLKMNLLTEKEKLYTIDPMQLPLNERNSNGSFMIDEDEVGEVREVYKEAVYQQPFEG